MTKLKPSLIPQRNDGKGWTMCPEHRATAWLVVSSKGVSIARYKSKRTALERMRQLQTPRKPQPEPGDRLDFLPADAPVLVRGLSEAQRRLCGYFK